MSGKAGYGNSTQPVHNFSLHHYGIVTYTIIQVCQNAPYAQCNGRLFTLEAPFQNSTLRHLKLDSRTWQLLHLLSNPLMAGGIHPCVMYETHCPLTFQACNLWTVTYCDLFSTTLLMPLYRSFYLVLAVIVNSPLLFLSQQSQQ